MPLFYSKNILETTWASRPDPTLFKGLIRVTDVGNNGSTWYSTGSKWALDTPLAVYQAVVPVGTLPSSYIANNGALTIGSQPAGSLVFSATSGSGVTLTGTGTAFASTDVGRVVTCDSGKQAAITAFTSTTVVTVTITGTLSTTIFANLAWWLGTPLASAISDMYAFFPANSIVAGQSAGLYYVQMSNTTTGTIFNNTYTTGVPLLVSSPTAFSSTGPGAFTQTLSETTLLTYTLPGNIMGSGGSIHSIHTEQQCNTAGTKTSRVKFGGTNVYAAGLGTGFLTIAHAFCDISNIGSTGKQIGTLQSATLGAGGSTQPLVYLTKDTTADQLVTYSGQLSVATDWIIFMYARLDLVSN